MINELLFKDCSVLVEINTEISDFICNSLPFSGLNFSFLFSIYTSFMHIKGGIWLTWRSIRPFDWKDKGWVLRVTISPILKVGDVCSLSNSWFSFFKLVSIKFPFWNEFSTFNRLQRSSLYVMVALTKTEGVTSNQFRLHCRIINTWIDYLVAER